MNHEQLIAFRKTILRRMHKYIIELGDEEIYMDWITLGVPDEPSQDDYDFIAENDKEWVDCCKLFGQLVPADYEENKE